MNRPRPDTEYAKLGDDCIAYQVIGRGAHDIVFVTGIAGNVDARWDVPPMANFFERLSRIRRLIMFDRRGCGASDPLPPGAPTWENWADDITAVMDAAGSKRAAIFVENDASPTGLVFAATFPERVSELIVWNGGAKYVSEGSFEGVSPDAAEYLAKIMYEGWGRPALVEFGMPSWAPDPRLVRAAARYLRACTTPRGAEEQYRYLFQLDVTDVLPSIHVPALVLQSQSHAFVPPGVGRHLVEHIDTARYVEVPGGDVWACGAGADEILALVEEFLTGSRRAIDTDRVLATVLFTDIVTSTTQAAQLGDRRWKELLDAHDELTRVHVERFGGRVVKATGDGSLATFDSPGRAIRCAEELTVALRSIGLEIRAGLHTGEIERRGEDIGGIAVHIGARVMGEADGGEVLCSRTVRDLVSGAGFSFEDRGARSLKGVAEEWQLFAVGR